VIQTYKPCWDDEKCHHYWICEPPDGMISLGVCKYCGARKEFLNIMPQDVDIPKLFRKTVNMKLINSNAQYCVQGSTEYTSRLRNTEVLFYVDRN